MKVVVATDIHGREEILREILLKEFDLLVLLGDLTNGMEEGHLFDLLPKDKTIFVPGNNEPLSTGTHGEIISYGKIKFFTLGGSLPTPFNTINEIPEEEYARIIREVYPEVDENTVILSHSPPYGALDLVKGELHVGIKSLRRLIEEKQPKLVLCGHIHEFAGHVTFIGRTPVINPGPRGLTFEF